MRIYGRYAIRCCLATIKIENPSVMKIRLIIFLCSYFIAQGAVAQSGNDNYVRDIINEKVRNPEYNDYMHQVYDIHKAIKSGTILETEGELRIAELYSNLRHDKKLSKRGVVAEGAEPCIAINPKNPDQLVLGFMQFLEYPLYYSHDGGMTWSKSNTSTNDLWREAVPSAGGASAGGGDPILVFDKNGVVHLTYILLDFGGEAYMLYARSDDGGITYKLSQNGSGYIAHGNFFSGSGDPLDREWLASDHSDGPYSGNTYFAGVYFGGTIGPSGILTYSVHPGLKRYVQSRIGDSG